MNKSALARQAFMRRQQAGGPANLQALNRGAPMNRRDAFINPAELENAMERSEDTDPHAAARFRTVLFAMLVALVLVLLSSKFFNETDMTIPDIEGSTGPTGGSAAAAAGDDASTIKAENQEEIDKWYSSLGVEDKTKRARTAPSDHKESNEEKEQRMLENFRLKKVLKENLKKKQEERNALVSCGRECQDGYKQLQTNFDIINSKVENELWSTVFDKKMSASEARRMSDKDLREAYARKKEELEKKTEEGSEAREMYLTELKEATEILQNPDARSYYHMYGQKPPEQLKHVRANHGGWGQELALKTFRNRLIMAWLQHFDSSWLDYSVIGLVIGVGYLIPMIFTVPKAIAIAEAMVDEAERMDAMENGGGGGGDKAHND